MENYKKLQIQIDSDQDGMRIDRALLKDPHIPSRSQAAILLASGLVMLQNISVKASHKVKTGESYTVLIPQKDDSLLKPYPLPLDILFEDEHLLVVNKPAGIVVHPSAGHNDKTLVNALLAHTKELSMGFNETRPGIVHRIDKETSGLLVIAKNNSSHENLAQQFRNRTIHRIYFALVYGKTKKTSDRIETLIGRDPSNRKRFWISTSAGKRAITNFSNLKTENNFSLLKVKLETGRTHQIRVHMSSLGNPIVGDSLYGADTHFKKLTKEKKQILLNIKRIALHAKELGFLHPSTGKMLQFSAPIPKDLFELYVELGFHEFTN